MEEVEVADASQFKASMSFCEMILDNLQIRQRAGL